jgi:hypothetical protein
MYSLYLHGLFLNFFSYKILKSQIFFFNFSGMTRVNPCNSGSDPQAGFDNYGCHENITLKNAIENK